MDATVKQNIVSACKSVQGLELVKGLLSSLEGDPWYVDYCQVGVEEACSVGNAKVSQYLLSKLNESVKMNIISACKCDQGLELVSALLSSLEDDSGYVNYCKIAMNEACRTGKVELMEYLLHSVSCSSNLINSTNESGETPLHVASKLLNVGVCKVILQTDSCNVNVQTVSGQTPLHLVVEATGELDSRVEIAHLLLAAPDCDPNMTDFDGCTALMAACKLVNHKTAYHVIIHALLCHEKCDLSAQYHNGNTALHYAVNVDCQEVVEAIISKNSDTTGIANKQGEVPLHIACKKLQVKAVEVLLRDGRCNVNLETSAGLTPLHLIVGADDSKMKLKVEIVALLLAIPDCNPNLRNADGDTPLILACKGVARTKEYLPIINAFLSSDKCDPNIADNDGDTALHFATAWGWQDVLKPFLHSKTCQPNVASKQGITPLHVACFKVQVEMVRTLLEQGTSNANLLAKNGHTPLHMVILANEKKVEFKVMIIDLLLAIPDCDPNIRNSDGDTPLILACKLLDHEAMNYHLIRALTSSGKCNPNIKNNNGDTALHIATTANSQEATKDLVYCGGCEPDLPNKDGETALHIACSKLNIQTVTVLLKEGRCDVNTQTNTGQTPLHLLLTAHTGNKQEETKRSIVHLILHVPHCDPHITDAQGITPLQIAHVMDKDVFIRIIEKGCAEHYSKTNMVIEQALTLTDYNLLHLLLQYRACAVMRTVLQLQDSPVVVNKGEPSNGDTPLVIAIKEECVEAVELLLNSPYCDPNVTSATDGHTALIIACIKVAIHQTDSYFRIVHMLLSDGKCDVNSQNDEGNTALHIAAAGSCQKVVNALLFHERCNPDLANKQGRTPLHFACDKLDIQTVTAILQTRKSNVNSQTATGQTPLHLVVGAQEVKPGSKLELTHLLLSFPDYTVGDTNVQDVAKHNKQCDPNVRNSDGETPLHVAAQANMCEILQSLLDNKRCDSNVQNSSGETPLHIACKLWKYDCVVALTKSKRCSINICDNNGHTALLKAIYNMRSNDMSIIEHLISDNRCDMSACDMQGNSALHIACTKAAWKQDDSMLTLVRRLLSTGKVNPQYVNNAGETPAQRVVSNKEVYNELSHFSETQLKHPIQTFVKVFVVGNAETGKSTLIEAICTEASKGRKYVPSQFKTVKGVKPRTAGIVPIPIHSRHFGNAIIYDFAGQHEYYSSHAAVLENLVLSSPPVFVVLVDLSEPFEQISEVVAYWWSFIGSYTARSHLDTPPHVAVVGSHKDVVKSTGKKVSAIVSKLLGTLDGLPTNFVHAGFAALNCTLVASDGLTTLLSLLKKTCEMFRKEVHVDLRCHVLSAFLQDRFPNSVACTLADIIDGIRSEESTVLPQSTSDLINLLATLSDKDRILLLKNLEDLERSWIILQRQKLYGEVNGSIFAPEYFDEHLSDFARSTGVVPLSKIKKHFPEHHPEIITGFLSHLEFCFKIGDTQTLELIADEEEYSPDEEFYFFPALVQVKNPPKENVWKNEVHSPVNTQQNNLKYGWFYECSHPHQYLMTRFLHVLLFRLAFSFALAMEHKPSHNFPAIRRKCSVWKRGISWLNNHGIETVLEIGLQNKWVVLLMQCSSGMEVECAKLRSAVVKIILDTKEEFCPSIGMHESLLHPCNVDYPFQRTDQLFLYHLNGVSKALVQREPCVVDEGESNSIGFNTVLLAKLLPFEPYTGLGDKLLTQLFTTRITQQNLNDHCLNEFSKRMLSGPESPEERLKLLARALLPREATKFLVIRGEDTVAQCMGLIQQARIQTCQNLKERLSSFSIFCGRNPLDLAGLPPAAISGLTGSEHDSLLQRTDDTLLGIESLLEVRTEVVPAVGHSTILGVALGLTEAPTLQVIQHNWPGDVAFQLTEIMAAWLQDMGNSSWRSLAKALLDPAVDCPAIAHAIMEQHTQDGHFVEPRDDNLAYHEVDGAPFDETHPGDILPAMVHGGHFSWFHLGLVLGLHYGTLKAIQIDCSGHAECVAVVITKWMNQVDSVGLRGQPSWRVLARALTHRLVGQRRLADDIARKHPVQEATDTSGNVSLPETASLHSSKSPQPLHPHSPSPSPPSTASLPRTPTPPPSSHSSSPPHSPPHTSSLTTTPSPPPTPSISNQ